VRSAPLRGADATTGPEHVSSGLNQPA